MCVCVCVLNKKNEDKNEIVEEIDVNEEDTEQWTNAKKKLTEAVMRPGVLHGIIPDKWVLANIDNTKSREECDIRCGFLELLHKSFKRKVTAEKKKFTSPQIKGRMDLLRILMTAGKGKSVSFVQRKSYTDDPLEKSSF